MSTASLVAEGRWAHMQGLRIIVDFASGSNLYPDLHVAGVEAAAVYSNDAILSLHRSPENYYSAPQCETDFRFVLSRLDTLAFASNQTLYLREADNKPPGSLIAAAAFVKLMSPAPRALRLAGSTGGCLTAVLGHITPVIVAKSVGTMVPTLCGKRRTTYSASVPWWEYCSYSHITHRAHLLSQTWDCSGLHRIVPPVRRKSLSCQHFLDIDARSLHFFVEYRSHCVKARSIFLHEYGITGIFCRRIWLLEY
eukprot:m.1071409 g.1071409  ORF g.1071409 m.1071409 type:complete len:252 (+) comp24231_c0_seq76:4124-4879(+)